MAQEILNSASERMDKSIESLKSEYANIRTGRASTAVLENITAEYYGVATPITQMASVSIPEARQLVIKPYDKSIIGDIEKAINAHDIGVNPQNDGEIIRLNFPQLTEERRKEYVKKLHKTEEEGKISIRNIRRDVNDAYKKMEKNKEITADELAIFLEEVQTLTDKYIEKITTITKEKEAEIMTV